MCQKNKNANHFLAFLWNIRFLGGVEFIEIQTGSLSCTAFWGSFSSTASFVDIVPAVEFNHNWHILYIEMPVRPSGIEEYKNRENMSSQTVWTSKIWSCTYFLR